MSKRVSQLGMFAKPFLDVSGNALSGGTAEFYTPTGTFATPKNAYTDEDKTSTVTSVTLNGVGSYPNGLYFAGGEVYDIRIKNSAGVTQSHYEMTDVKIPETTQNIRTITATTGTSTTDDDLLLMDSDSAGAAQTVTLGAVATYTRKVAIKNTGTTYTVTVDGNGSELIDGSATIVIAPGAAKDIYPDTTAGTWSTVTTSAGVTSVTAADGTVVLDGGTDGTDATFTGDITGGIVETGTAGDTLKIKTIEIGEWDMDATNSVQVLHGLPDKTVINAISVVILRAGDGFRYMFMGEALIIWTDTYIELNRTTSSFWDNVIFNGTGFNRGYINIWYKG